jgi:hypothetical protein
MDFLASVEGSALATWVRESNSIWAYPTVLFLHSLGMATVVGVSAGIDLRILGFAPDLPLASLLRFFPIIWAAFAVNALSGTALLIADATAKLSNPVFYVKIVFIALALINLRLVKTRVVRDPLIDKGGAPADAKLLAATSLLFWIGAITAGRLMAYLGPVSGLQ